MMCWEYCSDNDSLTDGDTSSSNKSLQPRQLFWELELESCEHMKQKLSEMVAIDNDEDNISLLTAEVVLDPYNLIHINFVLEPCALEESIRATCILSEAANSGEKGLYRSVMELEYLPLCAEKYGTFSCPCVTMSHLSSPDYQQDIRKALYMIGELGGQIMADQFLLSMLVGKQLDVANVAFTIPGLFHDGDAFGCRKFVVCRQQFRNLFGLTEAKVSELEMTKLKSELPGSTLSDIPFQWSPFYTSYKVGARTYNCIDDACY